MTDETRKTASFRDVLRTLTCERLADFLHRYEALPEDSPERKERLSDIQSEIERREKAYRDWYERVNG